MIVGEATQLMSGLVLPGADVSPLAAPIAFFLLPNRPRRALLEGAQRDQDENDQEEPEANARDHHEPGAAGRSPSLDPDTR
jgi:hypothetical protein